MCEEVTVDVIEKKESGKVRKWISDHSEELIIGGIYTVIIGGSIALSIVGYKKNKEWTNQWKSAMNAFRKNDTEYDYGPYKVMRFFEPKDGTVIGDILAHKDLMETYLKCNKDV